LKAAAANLFIASIGIQNDLKKNVKQLAESPAPAGMPSPLQVNAQIVQLVQAA